MKKQITIYSLFIIFVITVAQISGQVLMSKSLPPERNYEPIIIQYIGNYLQLDSINVNTDKLFLFAYHSTTWDQIPYQIDAEDPYETPNDILDSTDTFMLLAKDLGDKVSLSTWIDDASAKSLNKRYEIEVIDSRDPSKKGWCYLFQSETLTKTGETYITYDPLNDRVLSDFYIYDYGHNWYPRNILITPAGGGNNTDFYERTKFRFALNFGSVPITLYEDNLMPKGLKYNQNSVIRLKREIQLNVVAGPDTLKRVPFTMTNFPYSSIFSGNIDSDLGALVNVIAVRMSYDLDSTAIGMTFYHGDSTGIKDSGKTIRVDGANGLDGVDTVLTKNLPNWTMVTSTAGGAGTLLTINDVSFSPNENQTESYFQYLYYWDQAAQKGTTMTDPRYDFDWGGDSLSFGDHGMLFESYALRGIFKYKSTSYMLPANFSSAQAQNVFYNTNSPLSQNTELQHYYIGIDDFPQNDHRYTYQLTQNYPNPFNPVTTISFQIAREEAVTVRIYNVQGELIKTLVDNKKLSAGTHELTWDGRDWNGNLVGSGIYFYDLDTSDFHAAQKMIFIK